MTPTFYKPDRVGTLFAPDLQSVAAEAAKTAILPAGRDLKKTALVLIDFQIDFCHPTGALAVPGAVADLRRTIEFLHRNLETITTVYASLDSHFAFQIFHPAWWAGPDGSPPPPFTAITPDDVKQGKWKPQFDPKWSAEYVEKLASGGRQTLIVWPYHAMIGSVGNALDPSLHEAVVFHSLVRRTQVNWIVKGGLTHTEHYSIFEPEVKIPDQPMGTLNRAVLDQIGAHDLIFVAGEAKSHCVLESLRSMVEHYKPETLRRVHLLQNCTSSVAHPSIDFETMARGELAKFAEAGLQLTNA